MAAKGKDFSWIGLLVGTPTKGRRGMNDYISKPIGLDILMKVLQQTSLKLQVE